MLSYLALYRGRTLATAELVAVSNDPDLIAHVSDRLLREPQDGTSDPAVAALAAGRRRALELVRDEAT